MCIVNKRFKLTRIVAPVILAILVLGVLAIASGSPVAASELVLWHHHHFCQPYASPTLPPQYWSPQPPYGQPQPPYQGQQWSQCSVAIVGFLAYDRNGCALLYSYLPQDYVVMNLPDFYPSGNYILFGEVYPYASQLQQSFQNICLSYDLPILWAVPPYIIAEA